MMILEDPSSSTSGNSALADVTNAEVTNNEITKAEQSNDNTNIDDNEQEIERIIHTKEVLCRSFDIEIKDDDDRFEVNGIIKMKDKEQFITVDHGNQTIKLIDNEFNVVSSIKSVFQPWDIAEINAELLVVSFPFVRLLQYIKVKYGSRIMTWYPVTSGNEYCGLSYNRGNIIAICKFDDSPNVPSIHLLDRKGNIEDIIHKTSKGDTIFVDPGYIAVNRNNDVMTVSDQGNDTVINVNKHGEVVSRYSAQDFKPVGICVDSANGSVIVCDQTSESILFLSCLLQPLQRIVGKHEDMKLPLSVWICEKTERVFVTMVGCPQIRMLLT